MKPVSRLAICLSIVLVASFPSIFANAAPNASAFSVGIRGHVKKLIIGPDGQHMFAIVKPDGKPRVNDEYGLYVFSLDRPKKPRKIGYAPIISPMDFAVSKDGQYVYVMNTWFSGYPRDQPYGLLVFDVSMPAQPKLVGLVSADIFVMHHSFDGQFLYLQPRNLPIGNVRPEIMILRANGATTNYEHCVITERRAFDREPIIAYAFATFPDNKVLAIFDSTSNVYLLDADNPCSVKLRRQYRKDNTPPWIAGGKHNTIYIGGRRLAAYRLADELELKREYVPTGIFANYHVDERRGLVSASHGKRALLFSLDGNLECESYAFKTYVGDAALSEDGILYVGLLGSLVVVDRSLRSACALTDRSTGRAKGARAG